MFPRERQRYRYGTTEWFSDYYRRNSVESANSDIKTHLAHVRRGFTRVFGTAKNALLLAFTAAATNVERLRNWSTMRGEPDPWDIELGDATADDASPKPRTRKRRRKHSHKVVGTDPPRR